MHVENHGFCKIEIIFHGKKVHIDKAIKGSLMGMGYSFLTMIIMTKITVNS